MNDRMFRIALFALIGLGLALTIAHVAYAIYAYQHASIIPFIAGEIW